MHALDTLDNVDDDRSDEINSVILKGLGVLVSLALVVALGTWLVVHTLGLNEGGSDRGVTAQLAPVSPLPTTALAVPQNKGHQGSAASDDNEQGGAAGATHGPAKAGADKADKKGLQLQMGPRSAQPMERLNLTGTYAGHNDVSLQVQRLEDGTWADFPTRANVNMGQFETYVMTSQTGPNKFRVYDPTTQKGSNVVTVTIG